MKEKYTGLLREALAWIENSAEKAPSLCADIRAALAEKEPAQAVEPEPVAYQLRERDNYDLIDANELPFHQERIEERGGTITPLYTHPAPAKPLSDEQRGNLVMEHLGVGALMGDKMSIYDAFMLGITAGEAAHGIK
jgi:hypothetical protein